MRVHYSMDHAIQDTEVGHNHGLLVAADGTEVGMEQLMSVECGMEAETDVLQDHMEEGDVHRQEHLAAQVADNKVFGDADLFVV